MERPNNTTLALLGGIGLLFLLLIVFAATRDSDQDVLGDTANFSVDNPDLNKACAGQPIYEQIKRALFREAMQVRPQDVDVFQKLTASASIRMENAVAEGAERSPGMVDCVGSMAIDLPPGVTTAAGRRLLMSDIYYAVDPETRRVVQLRNADRVVAELAGLAVVPVQQAPPPVAIVNEAEPELPQDPLAPLPPGQPQDEALEDPDEQI